MTNPFVAERMPGCLLLIAVLFSSGLQPWSRAGEPPTTPKALETAGSGSASHGEPTPDLGSGALSPRPVAVGLPVGRAPLAPPLNETTPAHLLQGRILDADGTPEEIRARAAAAFGEDLGLARPAVEEYLGQLDPSLSPQGTRFFGLGGGMPVQALDGYAEAGAGQAYGPVGHPRLRGLPAIDIPSDLRGGMPLETQAANEVAQAARDDQNAAALREKSRGLNGQSQATGKRAAELTCEAHGNALKGQVPCKGVGCGGGKVTCGKCAGKGNLPCTGCFQTGMVACQRCGGKGKFPKVLCTSCRNGQVRCTACDTWGQVGCHNCGGTGKVTQTYWCSGCSRYTALHQLGGNRSVMHSRQDYCGTCRGSGRVRCGRCGGRTWLDCPRCTGGVVTPERDCPDCILGQIRHAACSGTGKITCSSCRGSGKVNCTVCGGRGLVPCETCTRLMTQRKGLNDEAAKLKSSADSLTADADKLTQVARNRRSRADRLRRDSAQALAQGGKLGGIAADLESWDRSQAREAERLAGARAAPPSREEAALLRAELKVLRERIKLLQQISIRLESDQQFTRQELEQWGRVAQDAKEGVANLALDLSLQSLGAHLDTRIKGLNKELDGDLMKLINAPGDAASKKRAMQLYARLRERRDALEKAKGVLDRSTEMKQVLDLAKGDAPDSEKAYDASMALMSKMNDPDLMKWLSVAAKHGENLAAISKFGSMAKAAVDSAYYATAYCHIDERIAQMERNTEDHRKQVLAIKEKMQKTFERIREIKIRLGEP